jgi:hypothetical protein
MEKKSAIFVFLLILTVFCSAKSQTFDVTQPQGSWRGIWINLTFRDIACCTHTIKNFRHPWKRDYNISK